MTVRRPEATSGFQKTSSARFLIYLHQRFPPIPPQLLLTSSFNDYLNCSFFTPPLLSLFQAKPIYGGWLCLAPEGTDFDNPMQRSRVRACSIGMHVCSLNDYTHASLLSRTFSVVKKQQQKKPITTSVKRKEKTDKWLSCSLFA